MCGIFAIFNLDNKTVDLNGLLESSISIRHRGPDDEGFLLIDTASRKTEPRKGPDSVSQIKDTSSIADIRSGNGGTYNLGMVFRRLSIIDLSPLGHQPMSDTEQNIWLIFNGEIYNYIEIRKELLTLGYKFKSGSDSEVIIYAYKEWGEECFKKFNGMWGIILYDKLKDKVICSRDRFGVKPMYYYLDKDNPTTLIVASELKAVIKYLQVTGYKDFTVNQDAVYDYFIYSFVNNSPETFLKNLHNLEPGYYFTVCNGEIKFKKYFDLQINRDTVSYNAGDFKKYCGEYNELFTDSVRLRLRTDASVGSCLSGGLDSSSIVCIINKLLQSDSSINREVIGDLQKTFSAVYEDKEADESEFIKEVVRYTNCSPHYIYPNPEDLTKEVEKFIYHLDEPFVSTSMYAQWNVMKLVHQNGVKVLLDGQGSDETVGGYEVYYTFFYVQLLKRMRLLSFSNELARNFSRGMKMITKGARFYFKNMRQDSFKGHELGYINRDFITKNQDRNQLNYRTSSNMQERLYEDLTKYLMPALLRYEDRNSMAFSIEARTPFLDYRLVEFAMNLPVNYKIHNGYTKWILRNSLDKDVPHKVMWRKDKKGFPTPEIAWLKSLKSEIINTISAEKNHLDGFLETGKIISEFDSILSNPNIKTNFIWKVYNYAKWKQIFNIK